MPFPIGPYRRFPLQCTGRNHAELSLLIAVLLLNVGQAFAEWVLVDGKGEEGRTVYTVYVDPDTIRRNADVVEFWVLMDFETTQTEPKPPHMSVKSQREIDCTKKRVRLLAMTAFSGNMGSGKVVHSYSDFNDQGIPIERGSVAETLQNVVCGKE
jgi:surface-adhesin protein E